MWGVGWRGHDVSEVADDTVIVIRGFMGTELIDSATGKVIWGLQLGTLASALVSPKRLAALAVDLPSRHQSDRRSSPSRAVDSIDLPALCSVTLSAAVVRFYPPA